MFLFHHCWYLMFLSCVFSYLSFFGVKFWKQANKKKEETVFIFTFFVVWETAFIAIFLLNSHYLNRDTWEFFNLKFKIVMIHVHCRFCKSVSQININFQKNISSQIKSGITTTKDTFPHLIKKLIDMTNTHQIRFENWYF